MMLRADVIAGLRSLFKEGATYSGLLRYILKQHSEELPSQTVQQYFMEAFRIPFFCGIKRKVESPNNDDYYAQIDSWLIARILSMRTSWMEAGSSDSSEPTWWDTLPLTPPDQFQRGKPAWLSQESWESLLPTEQENLAAVATSCDVLSEHVLMLARLSEQLQRQISQLDSPACPSP